MAGYVTHLHRTTSHTWHLCKQQQQQQNQNLYPRVPISVLHKSKPAFPYQCWKTNISLIAVTSGCTYVQCLYSALIGPSDISKMCCFSNTDPFTAKFLPIVWVVANRGGGRILGLNSGRWLWIREHAPFLSIFSLSLDDGKCVGWHKLQSLRKRIS